MNDMEANSLIRGLVFAAQKTRSDISESMGTEPFVQELLAEINPLSFGSNAILPRLMDWQEQCAKTGVIKGSDVFNFVKYIDMSNERAMLGLLAVYGYTTVPLDGPPIAWFTQEWPYLSGAF